MIEKYNSVVKGIMEIGSEKSGGNEYLTSGENEKKMSDYELNEYKDNLYRRSVSDILVSNKRERERRNLRNNSSGNFNDNLSGNSNRNLRNNSRNHLSSFLIRENSNKTKPDYKLSDPPKVDFENDSSISKAIGGLENEVKVISKNWYRV